MAENYSDFLAITSLVAKGFQLSPFTIISVFPDEVTRRIGIDGWFCCGFFFHRKDTDNLIDIASRPLK